MFRKEVIYKQKFAIGESYIETEIKYYVLGILIYKISKTEME